MDNAALYDACARIVDLKTCLDAVSKSVPGTSWVAATAHASQAARLRDELDCAFSELRAALATAVTNQAFADLVLTVLRDRVRATVEIKSVDIGRRNLVTKLVVLPQASGCIDEDTGLGVVISQQESEL